MASLQIRQLTKWLGGHLAVRGVDLDIADGELLVIVGPSGCGKTSVLRMVAGLETPSAGRVLLGGKPLSDARRSRWPVAMMFQEAALYPHLRVRDNIGFPLKMAGVRASTIAREVESIATTLGIRPLLSRRPSQLSGGQRQRVAMARSLIRRPEVLLMDEPMSNLDAKLRGELRSMIGHLQHDLGITTLYVTHDQVEAMSLGDRIAVMRDGVMVQVGTPAQIYDTPVDAFVATFIGLPTMNLFTGVVRAGPAVEVGSATVGLSAASWAHLAAWDGHRVVVGIRPQALRFTDGEGAVVDVEHIEAVGDRRIVTCTMAGDRAHVVTSGVAIEPGPARITIDAAAGEQLGEELWRASHVIVDPDQIYLFDADTGRTLREAVREVLPANGQAIRATT